jgi:hypothetical protein
MALFEAARDQGEKWRKNEKRQQGRGYSKHNSRDDWGQSFPGQKRQWATRNLRGGEIYRAASAPSPLSRIFRHLLTSEFCSRGLIAGTRSSLWTKIASFQSRFPLSSQVIHRSFSSNIENQSRQLRIPPWFQFDHVISHRIVGRANIAIQSFGFSHL